MKRKPVKMTTRPDEARYDHWWGPPIDVQNNGAARDRRESCPGYRIRHIFQRAKSAGQAVIYVSGKKEKKFWRAVARRIARVRQEPSL